MAPRQRILRSDLQNSPRASRHAKPRRSYQEYSTDHETEEEYVSSDSDDASLASKSTRNARPLRSRHVANRSQARPSPALRRSSRKPARNSKRKRRDSREAHWSPQKHARVEDPIPYSNGKVPNWAALPYEILRQIFQYAAEPLYDEKTFQSNDSVRWLSRCALLCRAFAEPALTVLYHDPPLAPMQHAHFLTSLLKSPAPTTYNYRSKVEKLQMEVVQTAAYTLHGHGILDLHGLIYNCPRLRALEIFHKKDLAPYRELDHTVKWTYPESLFTALEKNVDDVPARLRSWRWNSRLAGKIVPIERIKEMHLKPPFKDLRKCALVNYQEAKLKKDEQNPEYELKLAEALSVLESLQHLILESSTLVNSMLMPLLPKALTHLEIINCWEVTSDDLSTYLTLSGSQLRSLTLNHNQSLNLSFLATLAISCPKLTSLYMDLNYFAVHSSYRDNEPIYDQLLDTGVVPTWPSSLRSIELLQLKKWDTDTAKLFFSSLLESAQSLPDLRRLVVKGILNISWRDRSDFRKLWTEPFTRVFQRVSDDPNPHLCSIGAYKAFKNPDAPFQPSETNETKQENVGVSETIVNPVKTAAEGIPEAPTRTLRARPIPQQYHEISDSESEPEEATSAPKPKGRPLARRELETLLLTAGHDQSTTAASDNSEADSDSSPLSRGRTSEQAKEEDRFPFIQGMCDVVDVKVDNLRPAETQFKEADFLDSEPEGDEDWTGDNAAADDGYAW